MPCRDYPQEQGVDTETQNRIDRLTRMLCSTLRGLERDDQLDYYASTETQQWWEQHKEEDAKREMAERLQKSNEMTKKRALSKLTSKEKRALGL